MTAHRERQDVSAPLQFGGRQCTGFVLPGLRRWRCCSLPPWCRRAPGCRHLATSRYRSGRPWCLTRCLTHAPDRSAPARKAPLDQSGRCQPPDDHGLYRHGAEHRRGGGGVSRWRLPGAGHGPGRHRHMRLVEWARHHLRAAQVPRPEFGADLDQWRPLLPQGADGLAGCAARTGAGAAACRRLGRGPAQGRRHRVFRRWPPRGCGEYAFHSAHIPIGRRGRRTVLPPGLCHCRLSGPSVGA